MLRNNRQRLLLLFVCLLCAGGVRVLPRFLGGVEAEAQRLAREEIATRLAVHGNAATEATVDEAIARNPQSYDRRVAALEAQLLDELRFKAEDGREHPYLADLDSYFWLRLARNHLRTGTICDSVVDGECRNDFAPAPVGRAEIYDQSLHTAAIVGLHRVVTVFAPGFPLSSTSYYVTVIVALLGVIPVFALGWRFGGAAGAIAAAIVFSFNPAFLIRTIGSDNDVWNVVLPLYAIWAGIEALYARRIRLQLTCAVAAAIAVGLHAATWAGWVLPHAVLCLGFAATAAFAALHHALRQGDLRLWDDEQVRVVALLGVVYFISASVTVTLAGPNIGFVEAQARRLFPKPSEVASARPQDDLDHILWPSHYETVAELRKLEAVNPASYGANVPLLFVGLAGAALAFLPRRLWSRWHLGALIGGSAVLVYAYIFGSSGIEQIPFLFAPAIAALSTVVLLPRSGNRGERAALMFLVWFAVSYALASSVSRFVMFLATPVAIGVAAVAGRIRELPHIAGPARIRPEIAVSASWVLVAALLAYPAYRGYVTARDFLPQMNDAWWHTLTDLRDQSPPGSIINAWWHDGHWVTYVAERPVIADGASLRTHVPYWFTRALLTDDERHAAGLLRMLDCGSAAGPYPEARRGAYGKLRAFGSSLFEAQALVDALARLDRVAAAALLEGRGFSSAEIASILESTHCTPPPAYVVLSNRLVTTAGWGVGQWDFGRALAALRAVKLPRSEGVRMLTEVAGYSEADARRLYRETPRNAPLAERQQFIARELGFLTKTWVQCELEETRGVRLCPLAARVSNAAQVLDAFEYKPENPSAGRLRIRHQSSAAPTKYTYRTPGTILLAGADELDETNPANATDPGIAVLIDLVGHRMLIAEAVLLRSTFTKLVFLDGRYLNLFDKVAEREAYTGERIFTFEAKL
jgi:dolichyl-diphosphooligosaccharide--protein glycosyltransferase